MTNDGKGFLTLLLVCLAFLVPNQSYAAPGHKNDAHYNAAGFFDMHVCNWPQRKLFFLTLFSTFQYEQVKAVTVYRPDGTTVGNLDLSRYRVLRKQGKPEKRVFISEFDVSARDRDGWYSALIELKDGNQFHARDYVMIKQLGQAAIKFPEHGENLPSPPAAVEWQPVPDARFYKVFIRDMWDENKLIHESKLLGSTRYSLPKGLLKPGGWYSWKVHARDINEDPELGDFNHGSINIEAQFNILD